MSGAGTACLNDDWSPLMCVYNIVDIVDFKWSMSWEENSANTIVLMVIFGLAPKLG